MVARTFAFPDGLHVADPVPAQQLQGHHPGGQNDQGRPEQVARPADGMALIAADASQRGEDGRAEYQVGQRGNSLSNSGKSGKWESRNGQSFAISRSV